MTSFDVIRRLKRIFPGTRMGHTGTLDPMATGVLPIALGQATKIIEYLENDDKIYQTSMVLGAVSDTQDAWGKIEYTGAKNIATEQIWRVLQKFTGTIEQIPPMYSAVHYNGQRLYDLARRGIEVERPPRLVHIRRLDLLKQTVNEDGLPEVHLEVECSKGTYIRTLCYDIGQELGTGAYMSALLRVRSGQFTLNTAHTLDEILDQGNPEEFLLPVDYPLHHFQRFDVQDARDRTRIKNGNRIAVTESRPGELIRIYDQDCLLAIARQVAVDGKQFIQPVKVFGNKN